jgi:hypothetical protein
MKNITVSVDADVLAKVRRYAVDHDKTVSALIKAELERIARQDDRVKRSMWELREMSDRSNVETGPVTWTREDVHGRRPLFIAVTVET